MLKLWPLVPLVIMGVGLIVYIDQTNKIKHGYGNPNLARIGCYTACIAAIITVVIAEILIAQY